MLTIIDADLNNPQHAAALVQLLNDYACDPMGGAEPISDFCKTNLIAELKKRPGICAVLALVDGKPAGFSICMEGFSTFACQPLLNIHDFAVASAFRGLGIGRKMLAHIQQLARQRGCCKITLEVLQGNTPARALYTDVGFAGYELDPAMGGALMMQKKLLPSIK
ncbi:MAG: GNAT family N-acetyltransferase [Undibacterium sp.]|uniref:GNAT family N-acetyltransferase n=1 Tax=Undibacterium sp. TaxID=1914977 RepID=UPI00272830B4|nr:GNAT family N-acetyltransferase [Undibacterium sp.]MDO8651424.1 GNAT family N-acetyltransferase [Undibacterium sp.]